MRLFKNAVGGRALNHPSASLKENCGVRCMEGREGGSEEIFVCEAVSCLLLPTRFILPSLWRWGGCRGHTLNTDKGKGFDPSLSLSLYILLSLLSFLLPSIPNFPSSSPPASCCPCRAHLSVHLTLPSVHLYILYALGTTPCPKWQSILHQRGARTKKKKKKDKKLQTALWWDKVEKWS